MQTHTDELDYFECTKPVTSTIKGVVAITILQVTYDKIATKNGNNLYCEITFEGDQQETSHKSKGNLVWNERFDFNVRSTKSKMSVKVWSEGKGNKLPHVVARHLFDLSKLFRAKESMASERVILEAIDSKKSRSLDVGFVWAQAGVELKRLAFSSFERLSSFQIEQKGILFLRVLEVKLDDSIEAKAKGKFFCFVDCQDQRAKSKNDAEGKSLLFPNFTAKFNIEKMSPNDHAIIKIAEAEDKTPILKLKLPLTELPYEEKEALWIDNKHGRVNIKWHFQRFSQLMIRIQELINAPTDVAHKFVLSNGVDKVEYETKKNHFHWPNEDSLSLPLRPGIDEATITVFESGVQKGFIKIDLTNLLHSFDGFFPLTKVAKAYERTKARVVYHVHTLPFPDETMDPEENYQHLMAQDQKFSMTSSTLSGKNSDTLMKKLGTLTVKPLFCDNLSASNIQVIISCQGQTKKTSVTKGPNPHFGDQKSFYFPICQMKSGPISIVINEIDKDKVICLSKIIYNLQSFAMFDQGSAQRQFYLAKKKKEKMAINTPSKSYLGMTKDPNAFIVIQFEWDSVDMNAKSLIDEEYANDKEEEKAMKEKLKQPRVEQAHQMAERERKELLEKQQAKKEKMDLEKRDLRKSWAGLRKTQADVRRHTHSDGGGSMDKPDIRFDLGTKSEDVEIIEELNLDADGFVLPEDKVEGDFSPSSITKEGPASIRYKVIVIGDSGVGKTGLYSRWSRGAFDPSTQTTIACDFGNIMYKVESGVVNVQIWDTAGQERHHAITKSYLRDAHGAVLVYDITSLSSFIQVKRWINDVKENSPECIFMLIGNKVDLPEKFRAVPVAEATKFARENNCNFMETSAKDNTNCAKAFQQFLQGTHEYFSSHPQIPKEESKKSFTGIATTKIEKEKTISLMQPNDNKGTSGCPCSSAPNTQ
jgi:small GTP-binding protein